MVLDGHADVTLAVGRIPRPCQQSSLLLNNMSHFVVSWLQLGQAAPHNPSTFLCCWQAAQLALRALTLVLP